MSAHAAAIEALAESLRGFVRRTDCRLLHVVTPAGLRRAVLQAVMAAEHAPDNRSSFLGFDAPVDADAPGWRRRIEDARRQHALRCKHAEPPIAPLPEPPDAEDELAAFAQQLWQLLECRPPGSEGLTVVLAPKRVDTPRAWGTAVQRLVRGPSLSDVRFVVIDVEQPMLGSWVEGLGNQAMHHEVRLEPSGSMSPVEDLAAKLAGNDGAMPRGVSPPPRPDVPDAPTLSDEGKRRRAVVDEVLAAALAMGSGEPVAAVAAQRKARDLCVEAGWVDEALQMELMLGGHLLAARQTGPAKDSFARALDGAKKADASQRAATAGFALGAVRRLEGEHHTALVAYAEAAQAAERSGQVGLSIEANRLAGQTAADLKMEPQAITFLTRAVKLGEGASTLERSRSSAGAAARSLVAICRKRRLDERAKELEAQAEVLERPVAAEDVPPPVDIEARVAEARAQAEARAAAAEPNPEPEPEPEPEAEPDPQPPFVPIPADASLPPPDLLAPQVEAFELPPAVGDETLAGALPPPMLGWRPPLDAPAGSPPPSSEDFAEGTSLLTLDEIASLHWQGDTSPTEDSRPWTADEIAVLQQAVDDALEPEATTMLSHDELAALRGDVVQDKPLPRPPVVRPVVEDDPLAGLEPIPEAETAPAAREPSPADKTVAFDPDEVTSFSLDEITALRDAFVEQQRKPPKRDDNDD